VTALLVFAQDVAKQSTLPEAALQQMQ